MDHSVSTSLGWMLALTLATGLLPSPSPAQGVDAVEFEIENAVLDTSILFVTGAQEAVQELRGAFGWPTFQEGLAEGIYYRFDPDGYARLAPTDRLDTDVFEVICRSRTVTCAANKGILDIVPADSGLLQIVLADLVEGEQFFLVEGTTEIQLPDQILQPMDARIESLLSANGELVIRRGGVERARVSLVGFRQTIAYLRWVAARQDYAVLPRDWPIPTGGTISERKLTAPVAWAGPTARAGMAVSAAPQSSIVAGSAVPAPVTSTVEDSAQIADLQREVDTLRSLLITFVPAAQAPKSIEETPEPVVPPTSTLPIAGPDLGQDARIAALEAMVAELSADLVSDVPCAGGLTPPCFPAVSADASTGSLKSTDFIAPQSPIAPKTDRMVDATALPEGTFVVTQSPAATRVHAPPPADTTEETEQIAYLMSEIGLDARTARMVLDLVARDQNAAGSGRLTCADDSLGLAFSDEWTRQVLADLDAVPETPGQTSGSVDLAAEATNPAQDFVFLSEYLQTILPPDQGQ